MDSSVDNGRHHIGRRLKDIGLRLALACGIVIALFLLCFTGFDDGGPGVHRCLQQVLPGVHQLGPDGIPTGWALFGLALILWLAGTFFAWLFTGDAGLDD